MPKPFIQNKNKQVLATFGASYRNRRGVETQFRDKTVSDINDEDYDENGEYYEGEDYLDEEEYYDDEEYTEEEYSEDNEDNNEDNKNLTKEELKLKKLEKDDDLSMIGFKKDGFDYSRFMKPIGGGYFIPAVYDVSELKKHKGGILDLVKNSEPAPYMFGLEEVSKDYKKSAQELELQEEDNDIKDALEEDVELNDFEELDDDFILQANGGTLDGLNEEVNETIKKFGKIKFNKNYDFQDDDDQDYYDDDDEDYEDYEDGEERRIVDEVLEAQFDKVLEEEYDDNDIGELDPEEAKGQCDVNNFEDVFDEFIEDYNKNHESLITQLEILKKNNSFIALTEKEKEIILARDWDKDILVKVEEPEEDEEDKWDCETILTTYTNLDNHPKLIREENPNKIKLSRKTGMPIGVLPVRGSNQKNQDVIDEDSSSDSEPEIRFNQGVSRKNETKDEKKLRKQQLKEDRKNKREQKKDLKVAFKKEEIKQTSILKDKKVNQSVTVRY